MSQFFYDSNYDFENSLIKTEKKLRQNILHKEMLIRYKSCKPFPKDLTLIFKLLLCKEERNLKCKGNFKLRAAAAKIQNQITKA